MREHVLVPRLFHPKPLATRCTQKGFFPCVDSLVLFQLEVCRKPLIALLTDVFLPVRMDHHVDFQTEIPRETLAARLTAPWLLPRVGEHVECQPAEKGEKHSAFVTAMFFLHILALKLLSLPSARHPWFYVGLQTESNL